MVLASVSCVKEFDGPIEQPVSGKWALVDKSGSVKSYIELKDGYIHTYNYNTSYYYSDKVLYGVTNINKEPNVSYPYAIKDGRFYSNGEDSDISIEENVMTLFGKKYYPLESIKARHYTTISFDEFKDNETLLYGYNRQTVSLTYEMESVKGVNPFGDEVTVNVVADWIKSVQVNENEVSFELAENNSGVNRTSEVEVSYPSAAPVKFKVKQDYVSTSVNLEKSSAVITYVGGEFEFSYQVVNPRENTAVVESCNVNWISDIKHIGNTVSYVVSENNTGASRQGAITLTYGNVKTPYTITQTGEASEVTLTKSSTAALYKQGDYEFGYSVANPRENLKLQVQCEAEWIKDVVIEQDVVSFTVLENVTGKNRTANIVLTYGERSATHIVQQDSGNVRVILSKTSLSCGYAKGSYSFTYTIENTREGLKAQASCQADWVEQLSVVGDEVSFTVKENNIEASRTADITLTYGSVSEICKVTQTYSAPKVTLSQSSKSCNYSAADYSFNYTISNPREGQTAQASTTAAWITDLVLVGNTVSFSVLENTGTTARTGNIVVSYGTASATYKVTQSYSTINISLSSNSVTISSIPGEYEFNYTLASPHSDLSVEATCNVNWITEIVVSAGKVSYSVRTNDSSATRTGKITLKYGTKSVVYTVNQKSCENLSVNETANSYIVTKSGEYRFKAVQGNSTTSVGTVGSVAVLWESYGTSTTPSVGSLVKSVSYDNGYVYFTTADTFKEGNAVIAAKNSSGTILWSWHIWLTDQPQEQVYYNNAGTMMDRNLGATATTKGSVYSLGLLYQWGRKDPFLGSSSISSNSKAASTITWPSAVTSSSSNGTIDYAVQHPTTFISYNSSYSYYDWYHGSDNARWGVSKTKYDPCPPGWKVPSGGSSGVWAKAYGSSSSFTKTYDSTNKGTDFSGYFGSASSIWYPDAGYLYYSGGSLSSVGSYGYYWSSTKSGTSAYRLYMSTSSTSVNPVSSTYPAYGCSVRCVKE